ncbi:MAG: group III truncated hemoglobin [Chitinophagales bacterium]|nr:group III truncated hemoglobin [Chitinophagales bacterium]HNI43833.1 group III truncated hemoglobin [Chitinophagales bacterium]HNL07179.1 group III truncated hemoglobin [Chitinophagales bacterium]
MTAKKDLQNKQDICLLVDTFYQKVRQNPTIGYIFIDIAQIEWEKHLPKIYAFWETVLLGENTYKNNVMEPHILLNRKIKLADEHFETWLNLWQSTVDELFVGENATVAKQKANTMQLLMRYKIQESEKPYFIH